MKLAVIPARGGSKRIPGKNVRSFAGKPMIAHSIDTAVASGLFDRIVVSTDDDEIARVSMAAGAEVPFRRPSALADDFTGTSAVVKHAIEALMSTDQSIDLVCCIYATAPLLSAHYLREGYDRLLSSGKCYAFSVTSYAFPIQRAIRMLADGTVDALFPEHRMTRSQDLEPAFHDAGQFYWGTAAAYLREVPIFSTESVGVVLPRHLVADIDTQEDWEHAELLHAAWRARSATGRSDRLDSP